jgi:hypothetical protein
MLSELDPVRCSLLHSFDRKVTDKRAFSGGWDGNFMPIVRCAKQNRHSYRVNGIASVEVLMPNTLRYPGWQGPYLAAILEMNSAEKHAKIATAEDAIRSRMMSSKTEPEERQAIQDALNALKFLNR